MSSLQGYVDREFGSSCSHPWSTKGLHLGRVLLILQDGRAIVVCPNLLFVTMRTATHRRTYSGRDGRL